MGMSRGNLLEFSLTKTDTGTTLKHKYTYNTISDLILAHNKPLSNLWITLNSYHFSLNSVTGPVLLQQTEHSATPYQLDLCLCACSRTQKWYRGSMVVAAVVVWTSMYCGGVGDVSLHYKTSCDENVVVFSSFANFFFIGINGFT